MEIRKLSKRERLDLYRAHCNSCVNPNALVEDLEILRLHKEGIPAVEIGARLNVAPELVRYRLRRAGFQPVPAPRFLKAAERRADIIRLHHEGLSAKDIAARVGLDLSDVYRHLRDAELEPRPSPEEMENTIRSLDEIIRLGKEGVLRYEIAKRMGSTWSLVAETLERSSVKPVAPACGELASWASTLSQLVDEIRQARPDTEPVLSKVEQLENGLMAISEAARSAQDRLPWRGQEADAERWCLADITYLAYRSLDVMDALKGCIRILDSEKLPKLLEQAKTCIDNISGIMGGAISEAAQKGK